MKTTKKSGTTIEKPPKEDEKKLDVQQSISYSVPFHEGTEEKEE